jgi:hypothetical protein
MHAKDNTESCTGRFYCGKWRTCERCARIRSAKLANRAEYLQNRFGQLALAVIKPHENTAAALRSIKEKVLRKELAPAGIWTIETGSLFCGLHLNLLTPATAARAIHEAGHHVELLRNSARSAAAYITKRGGMPPPEQYSGRLMGEWGKVAQVIMESRWPAVDTAKAALYEWSLMSPQQKADKSAIYRDHMDFAQNHQQVKIEKTKAEYAEIARRNLSNVYAAVGRVSL